jgi:hypothetical protein
VVFKTIARFFSGKKLFGLKLAYGFIIKRILNESEAAGESFS